VRNAGVIDVIRLPWSVEDRVEQSVALRMPIVAGRGERVLLVEDDAAVREVTRRLLGGAGYAVLGVPTAEDALASIAQNQTQLVITDIDLPGMSGVDLARQIGAQGRLPVVFTSGMASDPSRLDGRPFLPKPYSADDLLRCVRNALDRIHR
jgi:CheY-like chemotaxis protein